MKVLEKYNTILKNVSLVPVEDVTSKRVIILFFLTLFKSSITIADTKFTRSQCDFTPLSKPPPIDSSWIMAISNRMTSHKCFPSYHSFKVVPYTYPGKSGKPSEKLYSEWVVFSVHTTKNSCPLRVTTVTRERKVLLDNPSTSSSSSSSTSERRTKYH